MEDKPYSNSNGLVANSKRNGNSDHHQECHQNQSGTVGSSGACSSSGVMSSQGNPSPSSSNKNEVYNDDETDDECCIYTYKGDSRVAADLPSSFFTFDQGDSLSSADESCVPSCSQSSKRRVTYNGIDGFNSSATTHHQALNGSVVTVSGSRVNGVGRAPPPPNDLFSPDMDFLEMDFDPGGFGDDEDDVSLGDQNGIADEHAARNQLNPTANDALAISNPEQQPLQEIDVTDSPKSGLGRLTTSTQMPKPCSSSATSTSLPSNAAPVVPVGVAQPTVSSSASNCLSAPVLPNFANLQQRSSHFLNPTEQDPSHSQLSPHLLLGTEPWNLGTPPSRQLMMRLVKSNTLPEMPSPRIDGSPNYSEVGENQIPGASRIVRNSCLSSSTPLIKNEPCYRAVINTSPSSAKSEDDFVEFDVGGIMIWTEEDVRQKSLSQIGTSACGATAVCNVLKALGFDQVDPSYVNSCVRTRPRNNSADIPEYLFSRSVAGATHLDLIHGALEASNGLVHGRFFQPKCGIEAGAFCKWLLHWICKGAVPVVTRNMQVSTSSSDYHGQQIPDAWHHQMIYGISPDKIFMTNPIERESPSLVIAQLTSPSVLLVRRSDVIDRKTPITDLRKIARHPNPEWNELNVLGQVANILLEEVPVFSSHSIAKRIRTAHVLIPAAYKGGVTLFMPKNSSFYPLLLAAPEL